MFLKNLPTFPPSGEKGKVRKIHLKNRIFLVLRIFLKESSCQEDSYQYRENINRNCV
jgi:hypothetical protein